MVRGRNGTLVWLMGRMEVTQAATWVSFIHNGHWTLGHWTLGHWLFLGKSAIQVDMNMR